VIYLAGFLAALCFMLALRAMDIVPLATGALLTTRAAASAVRDSSLSDADKERLLQKASLTLIGIFGSIAIRALGAITASLLPLAAFHAVGMAPMPDVVGWLATWPGIVLTTGAMTAACFIKI
jgi:hypothetical protein